MASVTSSISSSSGNRKELAYAYENEEGKNKK
jgi:hypothetical protein